jgi:hypothetical protein
LGAKQGATHADVQSDGLPLSDFEETDNDEPEIFKDKSDEMMKVARETTTRWFQP